MVQSFPADCPGSANVPRVSQPFLGVRKHVFVPRLEEKLRCKPSLSPHVLPGFFARRFSPVPVPRPRSQRGWELPAGQHWKYSASCATNDFLRQTIGAAGSYRSPLPIPAGTGGGTGPRGAAGAALPGVRLRAGPAHGHAAPTDTSAASELLIPKSCSGRVRSPDFRCLLNISGCTVQTRPLRML